MKAIYIILQDYNKYIIIYINFIFINLHDIVWNFMICMCCLNLSV